MKLIDYLKSAANIESRVARAVVLLWHTPMYLLAGVTSALGVVKTVAMGPVAKVEAVVTDAENVVSRIRTDASGVATIVHNVEQAFVAVAPAATQAPQVVNQVAQKLDPGLAHAVAQAPAAIVDDQDG